MKLSSLPSKPVVSPAGEGLGYVKSVYVCRNLDKLSCLVCVDGEEEEFVLPARAILSVGDAVVASRARADAPSGVPCPVGKGVFDCAGNFLGGAEEWDTEEGLTVFCGGERTAFAAERVAAGDRVIVFPGKARRAVPPKTPKKQPAREPQLPQKRTAGAVHGLLPPTVSLQGANLLGKRVKKTVLFADGVLVGAGEEVTPAVLKRAREHNLLVTLAANTLTE